MALSRKSGLEPANGDFVDYIGKIPAGGNGADQRARVDPPLFPPDDDDKAGSSLGHLFGKGKEPSDGTAGPRQDVDHAGEGIPELPSRIGQAEAAGDDHFSPSPAAGGDHAPAGRDEPARRKYTVPVPFIVRVFGPSLVVLGFLFFALGAVSGIEGFIAVGMFSAFFGAVIAGRSRK